MAALTSRIEFRADPDEVRRIQQAAQVTRKSVSRFVLEAATARAEKVIADSTSTRVQAAYFDALWAALESPPEANDALRARARAPRQIEQK